MAVELHPSKVSLTGRESACFVAREDGEPVQVDAWELSGCGRLRDGVYRSPWLPLVTRRYVVTAVTARGRASAEIEVSGEPVWIACVALYFLAVMLACAAGIRYFWPETQSAIPVVSGPALVTLRQGASQQFSSSREVAWPGLPEGRYRANAGAGSTLLFPAGAEVAGDAASVMVSESEDVSLQITPGFAVLKPGEKVSFHATPDVAPQSVASERPGDTLTWELTGGGLLVDGEYSAPQEVRKPSVVTVTARMAHPGYATTARVLLLPAHNPALLSPSPGWLLILMAAFCGALGATLHGIRSFVAYVGSRQFVSSWAMWYFALPFVGGMLGPLMFLVFRGNLVSDTQNIDTADWLTVAALASLSGLFADKALDKLKQIVEVVFSVPESLLPHKLAARRTQAAAAPSEPGRRLDSQNQ